MNSAPPALARRAFLRGSAVAALAILGTGTLAGCRSAVHAQAGSGAGASARPVRGGTLRVGMPLDVLPSSFLVTGGGGANSVIGGLVYETLTRYPLTSVQPQPLLAKSWQLSEDGLRLTLDLRDDVRFHSGRPFTSADAEFSLRTYADPKWTAQLASTAAAITGYDSSDPRRLVLTFAHRLGNVFDLLELAPMLDRETFAQFATGESYIGTGPFRLTSRTPNSQMVFERNPGYRVPERPYLDKVVVSIIPDAQAQLNALRSGQIDYTSALTYRDSVRIGKTAGFATTALDGAEAQIYVGANVSAPALRDIRVRQAIAYAIDRERIMTDVYRGTGYAVNLPWPKTSPAYRAAANTTFTRDVAKAKSLLAQTGPVPPLPLTYPSGTAEYESVAQIVQSNLGDVGLRVQLQPVEMTVFLRQLIGAKFPGLWVVQHGFTQYVPSTLTVSAYPFNAAHNASRFSSAAYTEAAQAAWLVPEPTGPDAQARYADLSEQLLKSLFLIEIGVIVPQVASSGRVHGVEATKNGGPLFTDAYLA